MIIILGPIKKAVIIAAQNYSRIAENPKTFFKVLKNDFNIEREPFFPSKVLLFLEFKSVIDEFNLSGLYLTFFP